MGTKKQLRDRWKSEVGRRYAQEFDQALRHGASRADLERLLPGLPLADEVAPALDLRGFFFPELVVLRRLDLSEARLDHAIFGGILDDCRLVDAVLDGCEAVNATLHFDLTRASFVKANLKGVALVKCRLTGANFTQAKMPKAQLYDAVCSDAVFHQADLRFAECARADFRGADLSGANLSDATLGGVRFDQRTRFSGAQLGGAAMSTELAEFVRSAGNTAEATESSYPLAEMDAAMKLLAERNQGKRYDTLLARLNALREQVRSDPSFDWGSVIAAEFPHSVMEEVAKAVEEAGNHLEHFLD